MSNPAPIEAHRDPEHTSRHEDVVKLPPAHVSSSPTCPHTSCPVYRPECANKTLDAGEKALALHPSNGLLDACLQGTVRALRARGEGSRTTELQCR